MVLSFCVIAIKSGEPSKDVKDERLLNGVHRLRVLNLGTLVCMFNYSRWVSLHSHVGQSMSGGEDNHKCLKVAHETGPKKWSRIEKYIRHYWSKRFTELRSVN